MISQVGFKNFKALAEVEIKLERLTVLVGANATGKTSVLDGLDFLGRLALQRSRETQHDLESAIFRGRLSATKLRTLGVNDPIELQVIGDVTALSVLTVGASFELRTFPGTVKTPPAKDDGLYGPHVPDLSRLSGLGPAVRLQLDPLRLGEPSYIEDERPRVSIDGFGLASVLAFARGEQSEAITHIETDLRRVVPRAKKIRTYPARITRTEHEVLTVNGSALQHSVERTYMGQRFELEIDGVGPVPADMLSEGTLLALGLLTVLHTTPGLKLLLLDDLDRGLHPRAQREVIQSIRAVLDENPQLQVVCTTHSPYALDIFKPEEVRVMKLDTRGHAHCKPLTDHPDWPRWREFMGAGEFWSSVGEDWVYGEANGG